MRALILLPLLALTALGQSVDRKIEHALKPDTPVAERVDLLKEIIAEGAAVRLAETGLDPNLDAGVVHAVVGALFTKDAHLGQLERICRLLLHDAHRDGTLRHIQRKGEAVATARPLVQGLAELARGRTAAASSDADLRLAGVLALGKVPHREAVRVIVDVWLKDAEDPKVKGACRGVLANVLAARSAREADEYLLRNPYLSYYDLMQELIDAIRREIDFLRKYKKRALEQATAKEAFESLDGADLDSKRFAAQRIKMLAASDKITTMTPAEFAGAAFDAFVTERDSDARDAETLAKLCGALETLWKAGPQGPLAKAKTPAQMGEVVLPLARGGKGLQTAGEAAVALLTALGQDGRTALVEFARDFDGTSVRRLAISTLGRLAARGEADYIALKLAEILARGEKDPDVLTQLLFTLSDTFESVPQAEAAVTTLLKAKIAERDAKYCIVILRKLKSDAARESLKDVAATHPQVPVRRIAVDEGIIPLARRNGEGKGLLAHLAKLVLSGAQPKDFRLAVIESLATSGISTAREVLGVIEVAEGLDDVYREAASQAKLTLAESLVAPAGGGAPPREDFDAALDILKELIDRKLDPERLEKLARTVVTAGDAAKLPVRGARYCIAALYKERKPADKATFAKLLTEAADKAAADGPPTDIEEPLLREFVALLVAGKDFPGATVRSERLAAIMQANPAKSVGYLLDAADYAVRSGDKAKADELVTRLKAGGALEGEAATRLADIEKRAAALG